MPSKKDVVRLTDADFEQKSRKTAPAGKYVCTIDKEQSKIKPGTESNILLVACRIKSGTHKGTLVFDNIAAHVGWKIAQLLSALGIPRKKLKASTTLQEILKMIVGKELKVVVRVQNSEEWGKQNKVAQFLPLDSDEEDDIDEDEEDVDDDEEEDDEEEEEEEDEEEEDEEEDEDEEEEDEDEDEEDDDSDEEDEEDEDEDEEDEEDDDEDDDEDEDEEDEDEDEDEDEEDDEDEEETPAPRGRKVAAKKAPAKKTVAKKAPAKKAAKKTTKKR